MLYPFITLLLSLAAIIYGADWMTKGASDIALRMKISPFIVGLTIVAMGTSAPELFVSVSSALQSTGSGNSGMGDIAIGNVVGSNIFNNLLIVGVVALIMPLRVSKTTVRRDLPIVVLASAMLFCFLLGGSLERWHGVVFIVCFIIYMYMTVKTSKSQQSPQSPLGEDDQSAESSTDEGNQNPLPLWKEVGRGLLLILIGLAILVYASDLFVTSASEIAAAFGVSEKIIGLTIVGAGTSAPELATSIAAARRGEGEMAIGNVIGSNVFNIFMILGLTGIIQPLEGLTINYIDISVLIIAALLMWLFSFTKYTLERWEGAVLVSVLIAYMAVLLSV